MNVYPSSSISGSRVKNFVFLRLVLNMSEYMSFLHAPQCKHEKQLHIGFVVDCTWNFAHVRFGGKGSTCSTSDKLHLTRSWYFYCGLRDTRSLSMHNFRDVQIVCQDLFAIISLPRVEIAITSGREKCGFSFIVHWNSLCFVVHFVSMSSFCQSGTRQTRILSKGLLYCQQ